MHSKVLKDLQKKVQFDNVPASTFSQNIVTGGVIPTLYGMRVITNDTLCAADTGVYPTYIGGGQPWHLSDQTSLYTLADQNILVGGGTTSIAYYYNQLPHLFGCTYGGADNPTNATLALGASWSKVWESEAIKLVQLKTLVS